MKQTKYRSRYDLLKIANDCFFGTRVYEKINDLLN